MKMKNYTRRDFLKNGLMFMGGLAFIPWAQVPKFQTEWPTDGQLGRNCSGGWINRRSKPSPNSPIVDVLYEDSVFPWEREVVGEAPAGVFSRRWIETPKGYVYAPSVQPVKNIPNKPVTSLAENPTLGKGMWVEVTVPYVDIILKNPPNSSWLQNTQHPRLYYSQVIWVDDVKTSSDGNLYYHCNEKYGLDSFWCLAEAFRPLTAAELAPIHPEVEDKKVVVDLNHQVLSCYEGGKEVYFCRVSTGGKYNASGEAVDTWATPLGSHLIWRKAISFHMQGGSTESGWDTLAIPWTTLFVGEGVAIHSVFWHNDFGTPRSHGCVNTAPEDAKWVFRWTSPHVKFDPGDLTIQLPQPSTPVEVIEA
jgi:lipoprotein-anchoring transpeptidase ErfK/SrfK